MLCGLGVIQTSFICSSMLLPTMLLMLAASLREAYPSVPVQYSMDNEVDGPDQAVLKLLRGLDVVSSTPSPAPVLHTPTELIHLLMSTRFHKRTWWYPELLQSKTKKRQNIFPYNWNSFGLRYGK